VYGNQKPTEFLCLTLKLLQLQPEKEILMEYLLAEEFKWVNGTSIPSIRGVQTSRMTRTVPVKLISRRFLACRYLRALAAFYIRLTFRSVEVYEILEPLMKDYKKLRCRDDCKSSLSVSLLAIVF
jgi:pre-mRNA-splicing factor 38A